MSKAKGVRNYLGAIEWPLINIEDYLVKNPPHESVSTLAGNIELVSKIVGSASKFGVLVGSVCIVSYLLRINHFPQEVSAGDGLLVLMAAACFGAIYILLVASLVALGITLSPLIRVVSTLLTWGVGKLQKRKVELVHPLAPFEWWAALLAMFSVLIIAVLGRHDSTAYWNLPLLSVGLYLFYSVYVSSASKIKQIKQIEGSALLTEEKQRVAQFGDCDKLRAAQLISIGIVVLAPLVAGGVSGQLLDAAMRSAHVRIEKPVIYVKEPYTSLLPKSLASKMSQIAPKEYSAFEGVVVLFKGFGKTTVISFPDGDITRKLEVPNDAIIIDG
jgi:hypothetical protein